MKTQLLTLLLFLQVSVLSFAANPTIVFNGYQDTQVCAPTEYEFYFISNMLLTDADNDVLSIQSITSTNNSLINPSSLYSYVAPPDGNNESYVVVSGYVGTVGAPTNVTLTYTFSDGNGGTLVHSITYTLKPIPTVVFLETAYSICESVGVVDMNDWVYPEGGFYQIDGEQSFNDGIFHTDWTNYDFNLSYTYTAANGCSKEVSVPVAYHEAPTIDLYTTNSSSCVVGDGAIDASIYFNQSTPSYTFMWNDGNSTQTDRTDMLPGVYHIDVTDQYGCISEATASIFLNGVSFNEVITPVTCYNGNDGAIDLSVTGLIAPVSMYWSSGQTSEDVSGLGKGTYTLNLSDATGCAFATSFYVPEPDEMYMDYYSSMPFDCSANGYISVNNIYGGTGPLYDIQWSNGQTGYSVSPAATGVHTATITDNAGCTSTQTVVIYDYNSPYAYEMNVVGTKCNANDGAIDLDTSGIGYPFTVQWSNGTTALDLVDVNAGDYILHLQDANGCDGYQIYTVPMIKPALQQICMVSVDSATTTNLVIWEKVDPAHVDYYNIYRETVNPGEFMWIDSVSNNNESIFNDVMASPTVQSWRYQISAVDDCGTEGPLSTAHKTMHITTTDLGGGAFQASWNPYYGVEYDFFVLYRYTGLTGWEPIVTLPRAVNSYIDTPPNSIDLDYMTELDLDFSCVADILKAQDFNTTRSNKDKGNFLPGVGTGDSNNGLGEDAVSVEVYPNPVSDKLNIVLSENGMNKTMSLYSVEGIVIGSYTVHSIYETIDMSGLANGMYFVKIEGQNATIPVVKQ